MTDAKAQNQEIETNRADRRVIAQTAARADPHRAGERRVVSADLAAIEEHGRAEIAE